MRRLDRGLILRLAALAAAAALVSSCQLGPDSGAPTGVPAPQEAAPAEPVKETAVARPETGEQAEKEGPLAAESPDQAVASGLAIDPAQPADAAGGVPAELPETEKDPEDGDADASASATEIEELMTAAAGILGQESQRSEGSVDDPAHRDGAIIGAVDRLTEDPAIPPEGQEAADRSAEPGMAEAAAGSLDTEPESAAGPQLAAGSGNSQGTGVGEPDGAALEGDGSALPADGNQVEAQGTVDGSGGLSDEQDFDAVSSRETIETDAERLKEQVDQLKIYEPTDLPERPGHASVARYAIETSHEVGTKLHRRFGLFVSESGLRARCAQYDSADAAQQAFLDAGGPEKDSMNLDPDGDGFVCGWSPEPYRRLLR